MNRMSVHVEYDNVLIIQRQKKGYNTLTKYFKCEVHLFHDVTQDEHQQVNQLSSIVIVNNPICNLIRSYSFR